MVILDSTVTLSNHNFTNDCHKNFKHFIAKETLYVFNTMIINISQHLIMGILLPEFYQTQKTKQKTCQFCSPATRSLLTGCNVL